MTVIGISGKKRSGKDTLADVLVERFGFRKVAFADLLREAALALDPAVSIGYEVLDETIDPTADVDDLALSDIPQLVRLSDVVEHHGWEKAKDSIPEVRQLLQRMGTEVGRELFGADFWVHQTFRRAGLVNAHGFASHDGDRVVIPDVRFPNELDGIQGIGGHVIRVTRPLPDAPLDEHPSETALDGHGMAFDYAFTNNGSLETLQSWAYAVGHQIMLGESAARRFWGASRLDDVRAAQAAVAGS